MTEDKQVSEYLIPSAGGVTHPKQLITVWEGASGPKVKPVLIQIHDSKATTDYLVPVNDPIWKQISDAIAMMEGLYGCRALVEDLDGKLEECEAPSTLPSGRCALHEREEAFTASELTLAEHVIEHCGVDSVLTWISQNLEPTHHVAKVVQLILLAAPGSTLKSMVSAIEHAAKENHDEEF